jgi:hypothetical protein
MMAQVRLRLFDEKTFKVAVNRKIIKIFSACTDSSVYENSGIKFECLGDYTTCSEKSMKNNYTQVPFEAKNWTTIIELCSICH